MIAPRWRRLMLVATIALAAPMAHATPWAPAKQDLAARATLNQAADAADAGDLASSARLSLLANRQAPSLLAWWNAGQAYMGLGRFADALALFDRILDDAELPPDRHRQVKSRRDLARAFLAAGAAARAARWDDARAGFLAILDRDDLLAPDRLHAAAALEDVAARRTTAELTGAAEDAPVTTAQADRAPAHADATPAHPSRRRRHQPRRPSRWDDTLALGLAGGGLAVVAIGGALAWHATGLDDRAADPTRSETDRANLADRAATERTVGQLALGLGAATVVAGAVMFAIAPGAGASPTAAVAPTSHGALVTIGGVFW